MEFIWSAGVSPAQNSDSDEEMGETAPPWEFH